MAFPYDPNDAATRALIADINATARDGGYNALREKYGPQLGDGPQLSDREWLGGEHDRPWHGGDRYMGNRTAAAKRGAIEARRGRRKASAIASVCGLVAFSCVMIGMAVAPWARSMVFWALFVGMLVFGVCGLVSAKGYSDE